MLWGSIEARCLRRRVLEIRLAGLPTALDGVTILHLSDVHAGHGPEFWAAVNVYPRTERAIGYLIAKSGDDGDGLD